MKKIRVILILFLITPVMAIEWQEYNKENIQKSIQNNKPIFILTSTKTCLVCNAYETSINNNNRISQILKNEWTTIKIDTYKKNDVITEYGLNTPSILLLDEEGKLLKIINQPIDLQALQNTLTQTLQFSKKTSVQEITLSPFQKIDLSTPSNKELLDIFNLFMNYAVNTRDQVNGGFTVGTKKIQPKTHNFLLDMHKRKPSVTIILTQVINTLNNITRNNKMHDNINGGFYSTANNQSWEVIETQKEITNNIETMNLFYYAHKLTQNPDYKIIADKTFEFIQKNLVNQNGGFKTSINQELGTIEEEFYSDLNAQSIYSLLNTYKKTQNNKLLELSKKPLQELKKLITPQNGILHNPNGVNGILKDNAWTILALLENYEINKEPNDLEQAQKLIKYVNQNFWDEKLGGYYLRNSTNTQEYNNNEFVQKKEFEANNVLSYALMKHYLLTGEEKSLQKSLQTLKNSLRNPYGYDEAIMMFSTIIEVFDHQIKLESIRLPVNEFNIQATGFFGSEFTNDFTQASKPLMLILSLFLLLGTTFLLLQYRTYKR